MGDTQRSESDGEDDRVSQGSPQVNEKEPEHKTEDAAEAKMNDGVTAATPETTATDARSEASDKPKTAAAPKAEPLLEMIERLRAEKNAARDAKKQLARNLKNAEKRKARLKRKARQLNDADLIAVLQMRQDAPPQKSGSSRDVPESTQAAPACTGTRKAKAAKK